MFSLVIYFISWDGSIGIFEILVIVFLFMIVLVSVNIFVKVVMYIGVDKMDNIGGKFWDQ